MLSTEYLKKAHILASEADRLERSGNAASAESIYRELQDLDYRFDPELGEAALLGAGQ